MSKAVRNILIISLCCFFLGIIIVGTCTLIVRVTGNSWGLSSESRYWTYENVGKQSMTLETVESIHLTLISEPVVIQIGGQEPLIEWEQTRDNQYIIRQTGSGALNFSREETESNNWGISVQDGEWEFHYEGMLRFLGGNWGSFRGDDSGESRKITITLPEGHPALKELSLDSVSSALTVTGLAIDDISCNGVDNNIKLENCTVDYLSFNTVNGRANLFGGTIRRIDADGLEAAVFVDRTDGLEQVSVQGLDARFEGTLLGRRDDYRFSAEGMGTRLKIEGDSYSGDSSVGKGEKSISVDGLNAELSVTFSP